MIGINDLSTGQRSMLSFLAKVVAASANGLTRVHVFSKSTPEMVCHFGKLPAEVVADGQTWDNYVIATGEVLDKDGILTVVIQTYTDVDPHSYGDFADSGSAEDISGWSISRAGKADRLRTKELMALFPYRSDIDITYSKRSL